MVLKRHTLVDISDAGRAAIFAVLQVTGHDGKVLPREKLAQVVLPGKAEARIPGIVRREEGFDRHELVPVGFSSPASGDLGRLRIATFARQADIIQSTNPYDLLAFPVTTPRNACMNALADAKKQALSLGLPLGVWGSAALEVYTGLPYTHQNSDLDLLVSVAPREALGRFLSMVEAMEKHYALRIDLELDLISGYGVQLKELFGRSRTVIGKSLTDVALLTREQVLAELPRQEVSQNPYAGPVWSRYD